MIDLRNRVLAWTELKRRYNAGESLSSDEQQVLNDGIPAREYREQIIEMIRHERRTAAPTEKVKKVATLRVVSKTPLTDFLTKEHAPMPTSTDPDLSITITEEDEQL